MEQDGKEYGVDFAQNEVPPYRDFGLIYTVSKGDATKKNILMYELPIYELYTHANIVAYERAQQEFYQKH